MTDDDRWDGLRDWYAQDDAAEQRGNGDHRDDPGPPEPPDDDNGLGVMRVRLASEMQGKKRKRWLAKNRIPRGDVTVLVGDEGIGKSLFWVMIVVYVTTGKAFPEFGLPAREPGHVLLVFTEDTWSTDVLPRLDLAGADMGYVSTLCDSPDGSGSPEFPTHMGHVIDADPPPVLVVVDAWLDTVDPMLRVRDGQQARLALHPWRQAATKTDAAVILLSHTNRLNSANTRDLYGATAGLRQKARMTLFAQLDGDRFLTVGPDKANSTRGDIVAARFRVDMVQVYPPTDDDDGTVAKLVYVGQSDKTARELALANHEAQQAKGKDDAEGDDIPAHLTEFAAMLEEYITAGDPCPSGWPEGNRRRSEDVYKAANACGGSTDKAKRVKNGIGAIAKRDDDDWFWFIPKLAEGKGA